MLHVLGALDLDVETTEASTQQLSSPRLRRLLAALSIKAGEVAGVDWLADAVWGDDPPEHLEGSLHNLVSRLRRQLADLGWAEVVVTRPPGYVLELSTQRIDANVFERLADEADVLVSADPSQAADLLEQALALWRGPAYAEFADEEFARARVHQLSERRAAAIESRIECALLLGDNSRAHAMAEQLTRDEPFRERPLGQRLTALYRMGRQADALAAYETFRLRMADELGLDPSPSLQQIQASILNADPALDQQPITQPPGRAATADPAMGNVPAPARAGLVGRADDEDRVVAALSSEPLVTLTGPGGVGKTSLALAVANRLRSDYAGGVWWCELAALTDGDSIAHAIATTLGLQTRHDGDATSRLVEALGGRDALLVLDNCEHLVAATAELVTAIARGCPRVAVLATSREPLGVDAEWVAGVDPLELPAFTAHDAATAARSPAVSLLVKRAEAAIPGFALDDHNATALAEIARRLDGLPLALELAAIRMRSIGPEDLASRLTWRFRLLRQGVRTAPGRHQTLEAVVRWSYELLTDTDQIVLELISAFSGSFSLELAEQLVARATEGVQEWEPGEVAGVVLSLADRSMVVTMTPEGHPTRWQLLETIRAYGRDRLGQRPYADDVPDLHAEIFADVTAELYLDVFGPGHTDAALVTEAEFDDLRAAVLWSTRHRASTAAKLVGGLLPYCEHRMPVEPLDWAERVIARAEQAGDPQPVELARVYAVAASCARFVGELDYAEQLVTTGLTLTSEQLTVAHLHYLQAEVALFRGQLDAGGAYLDRFSQIAAATGHPSLILMADVLQLLQLAYLGDGGVAATRAAELDVRAAAFGPRDTVAAWVRYAHGEVLIDLDPPRAQALLDSALDRARLTGDRYLTGVTLVAAASLRARHGDAHEAARLYVDVIEHWFAAGDWTHQWTTMRNVVDLLTRLEEYETTAVLLGALDTRGTTSAGFGAELQRTEASRDVVAAQLYPERRDALSHRGAAMSDEQVVAYVIARLRELAG